jgi:hypothetical protein
MIAYNVSNTCCKIINKLKEEYTQNRYVFIKGGVIISLLRELGASKNDIIELQNLANLLENDPTLDFRKSKNARYQFDFINQKINRLIDQPFILTKEEDFNRHDSGILRVFDPINQQIQDNQAFKKLLIIKYLLIKDIDVLPRKNLVSDSSKMITTLFYLRTVTTNDLLGEPAKEGVHSDGVEHTMTTFLNAKNMNRNSGITKLHLPNEKNGISWNSIQEDLVVAEFKHVDVLDTLLIVDSELKHSVSPVFQETLGFDSNRDMIIMFSRRRKSQSNPYYIYDNVDLNKKYPMNISIDI